MAPYFLRNLLPHREQRQQSSFATVLGDLKFVQWAQLFVGWLAWTSNAVDFFSVSLCMNQLKTQFNRSTRGITAAITLTLLFRSLGSIAMEGNGPSFATSFSSLALNLAWVLLKHISNSSYSGAYLVSEWAGLGD